jgi:hypothetical protein
VIIEGRAGLGLTICVIACPNFVYNRCDNKWFVMMSANSELESPRTGALLEGVMKDWRIRKCASAEVELWGALSHSRRMGRALATHRGCFEIDDSSNRLTLLIRNTQLSRSGPRAGAYRTPERRSVVRATDNISPTFS